MSKWKEIPGYGGVYIISKNGVIKSISRFVPGKDGSSRLLKEHTMTHIDDGQGYLRVKLSYNGREKSERVHRLIALCFIPNPQNKLCINHKNGKRWDNRINNIEWCTKQENADHKYNVLKYKHPEGADHKLAKKIIMIDSFGKRTKITGIANAARIINGDFRNVSAVLRGKAGSHKGYKFRYMCSQNTSKEYQYIRFIWDDTSPDKVNYEIMRVTEYPANATGFMLRMYDGIPEMSLNPISITNRPVDGVTSQNSLKDCGS